MLEPVRGCGLRSMGGLYLEGSGLSVPCDRLPFNIELCPICEQGIKFTRGFTWIHWYHYAGIHENGCKCRDFCPICHPKDTEIKTIENNGKKEEITVLIKHGLMWVGNKYYTPESFVSEAQKIGISKKIATLPREIEFGETWILLAHQKAGENPSDKEDDDPEKIPAVFYAFKPRRVVKIITPKQAKNQEYINNLKKRGITPLVGISDSKGKVKKTYELDEWNKKGFLEKIRE